MALESSVSTIYDLVASNPTSGDPKTQGDDHIRNIKAALLASFAKSVADDGYQMLGGIILQWGNFTYSGESSTVSFPMAFPTACLSCIANGKFDNSSVAVTSYNTTQFVVTALESGNNAVGSHNYNFIAIGY